MIPRLHERTHTPHDLLAEALGRPVSPNEGLKEYTVVAHWPGLDFFTLDNEQKTWTSVQLAEHLEDPYLERPFPASPDDDRRAILHLDVRLHPDYRELTGPEWAEAAHRLARAAGIEIPGKEHGCQWIAVQAQPGRLDLIANLIHLDGAWHAPPRDILRRLADEARRIEQDLHLIPVRSGPTARAALRTAPTASAQLASVLTQLADEQAGPLATVRGLVEHTAHQIARQLGASGTDTAHRLELIARRLHAMQQDLDTTAAHLVPPRIATVPAATGTPHTNRRRRNVSLPRTDRFLDIRRDPHSDELLARGGDSEAQSILQRAGFIAVVRVHETYHRAPTGLTEDDESRLATDAVGRLRAAGYHVDCDEDFDTDTRPASYLPLGASVAHLAERIRNATTTDEAACALTAAHDGILAALEEVLTATADFHDGLGTPADPYIARRLRYLADEHLRVIRTGLADTRNTLADRHAPHPGRSTCTGEVPATERERSAVCTCPPPPRTLPAPPSPVAATLRR
ncbi:hypothetical protein [Streptomyces mirabilis]|uniref:hypothetical protein n=1 Tax=Streptomyces mirabilis TaxID=68239 RepID=UPI0034442DFD